MRAIRVTEKSDSADALKFALEDVPRPVPGDGQCLVEIHASGVNPSDVKARAGIRGEFQFPRIVPHSDGAGVIDAVGADVDSARIGERVWVFNAAWQRAFLERHGPDLGALVRVYREYSHAGAPVHTWDV